MKRFAVIVSSFVLAGAASATLADTVKLSGSGWSGGSFGATITKEAGSPFGGPVGGTHITRTFCIETEEFFTPGTSYFVEYATSAVSGGGGAVGGQDPIGSATAWLFSRTISGLLSWDIGSGNTTFDVNNITHNKAVQEAIWQLEQENWSYSGAASTIGKIRDAVKAQALADSDGSLYGVMVMRLWQNRSGSPGNYSFSGNVQDQLVLIPLPPSAWAGLSMLAGLAGLAYMRRQRLRA